MSQKAEYMAVAEFLGQKRNMDAESFLSGYRKAVRESTYPGPECLEPHEIETLVVAEQLPAERLAHLDTCTSCSAAVEAAQPDTERREQLLEAVRKAKTTVASTTPARQRAAVATS